MVISKQLKAVAQHFSYIHKMSGGSNRCTQRYREENAFHFGLGNRQKMIRKYALTSIMLIISMFSSMTIVFANGCPSVDAIHNAPGFPVPEKTAFNHFGNSLLSALFEPYHMVHDSLVGTGESATIVGKFDYDIVAHKDLEGENVKVYLYGTGMSDWEFLGTYLTNSDGKIHVPVGVRGTGHFLVHMVVTGDLTTATGYLTVIEPGTKAVLFDIDGTLTLNDFEAVGDYLGISTAEAHYYAPETVNAYQEKGYCMVYLSARPYWLMKDTREWLTLMDMPLFHAHTNPNAELFEPKDTVAYKTDYISALMSSGLEIIRAYGNADSDIEAYANTGIPKSETYIIGDLAGQDNTQAINDDYSYHYSTVVSATENADQ
jgi:hypothetical protein